MPTVNKKSIPALKLSKEPAYAIAQRCNVDPNVLSKLINGIIRPSDNDQKTVRVNKELNHILNECFQEDETQT